MDRPSTKMEERVFKKIIERTSPKARLNEMEKSQVVLKAKMNKTGNFSLVKSKPMQAYN